MSFTPNQNKRKYLSDLLKKYFGTENQSSKQLDAINKRIEKRKRKQYKNNRRNFEE